MATTCSSDSSCARFTGLCLNGFCTCFEVFGVSGETCTTPTAASGGSAVFVAVALAITTGFIVYNSRTLYRLLTSPIKVFKFNLAGRVYAFSWAALLATWIGALVAIAAPFDNLLVPVLSIDYFAVVLQIYAMINLVFGFLKFSVIKTITQKAFYKEYSAIVMVIVVTVFITVLVTLPFEVASYIAGGVFLATTMVATVAPYALFVSVMTTKTQCSRRRILLVALEDSILRNGALFNFVGTWDDSRNSLTHRQSLELEKRDSKGEIAVIKDLAGSFDSTIGSRTASFFDLRLSTNGSFIISKEPALPRTGSNGSVNAAPEKQSKKAEFFQRSIRAGNQLLLSGLGVCAFWLVFAMYLPLDGQPRTDFTLTAVFWACRIICLGVSIHVVVRFSGHVYKKNIRDRNADRKSRRLDDSKTQQQPSKGIVDAPDRPAWIIRSTDSGTQRPLSAKKLVVAVEDQHTHQNLVGKGGSNHSLNPKLSGKRMVDEGTQTTQSQQSQQRQISSGVSEALKSEVNTSGVFSVRANGVIDQYVEDDADLDD